MFLAMVTSALVRVPGILTIPASLAAAFARRFDRITRRYPRAFSLACSWACGALLGVFVGLPLVALVFWVTHKLRAAEASEAVLALGCACG